MTSVDDDRLTNLPEEIVINILSLMPTRYAVQTSILSKRWRYAWMFVTNLDFDDDDLRYGHDYKFVDRVIELCKSSQVNLFRLRLRRMPFRKSRVSKWIDKAMRLNVRELDIQLYIRELPVNFLTCKTITKLRIDADLGFCSHWEDPSAPINLPFLKTLDIDVSTNRSVNAFKLLSASPILESLSLKLTWCYVEEGFILNIPTLKRMKLTLGCTPAAEPFSNKVVLNVPNLEYLFVGGKICSYFVMEDVSSLVEVATSLNVFRFRHRWFDFLKGINGVTSFSVKENIDFLNAPIISQSSWPIFSNMKQLELKGCFGDYGLISQFLQSSPQLKHLCIKQKRPFECSWIEPKLVPACMLKSLTTINFSKYKELNYSDIEFLKYMLENAEVLQTITIILDDTCIEEETRLRARLLNLPKASQYCEVLVIESCSPSTDLLF